MSRGAILHYVEGDVARTRCQLEGQDLTDLSFTARLRRSDTVLVVRQGQIESVGSDWFFFDWQAGDLIEGVHTLDIVVTDPAGSARAYPSDEPILVRVRRAS